MSLSYRLDYRYGVTVLFLWAFFVYLFTATPGISLGDAGELIVASWSLGIAHPPGYSGWSLFTKLFLFLPVGNIAYRAVISSAFCSGCVIACLFMVYLELGVSYWLSMITAFWMMTGLLFWSQAVIAEVYALNAFLTILLLLLALHWNRKRDIRYGYCFWFIAGLSISNHQTILLFLCIIALYCVKPLIQDRSRILHGCVAFLLFSFGVSTLLYLPIRAHQQPAMNWGTPETWQQLVKHVERTQYGGFQMSRLKSLPKTGYLFYQSLKQQLTALFSVVSFLSFLVLGFKIQKDAKKLLFLFIVLGPMYLILLSGLLFGEQILEVDVYFIPASLILSCGMPLLITYMIPFAGLFKKQVIILVICVFSGVILWQGKRGLKEISERSNYLLHDFGIELLRPLDENSIMYAQGDYEFFSSAYLQAIEHYRVDVLVLDVNLLNGQDTFGYMRRMPEEATVYVTNKVGGFEGKELIPETLSYCVGQKSRKNSSDFWKTIRPRLLNPSSLATNAYFERMIWSHVFFFRAARGMLLDMKRYAIEDIQRGVTLSYDAPQTLNNFASILAENGYWDEAIQNWQRCIEIDTTYVKGYNNLGIVMKNKGERIKAVEYWEQSLLIQSDQPRIQQLVFETLTQPMPKP